MISDRSISEMKPDYLNRQSSSRKPLQFRFFRKSVALLTLARQGELIRGVHTAIEVGDHSKHVGKAVIEGKSRSASEFSII